MTEEAGAGHNSVVAGPLKAFIERIERMEEKKKACAEDIKEIFGEAKGQGYDAKTMRKIIKIRKMDEAMRDEEEALLDVYLSALGML